jgi:tetratricopeptide (TPR) repeat protein
MGIFGRLFSDPQRDLDRAETLLARGEPGKALELAERAAADAPAQAHRARELASRAREAVVATDLERAARAEASEYWQDAADWVRSALDYVDGDGRRGELEARLASLLERAREAEAGEPFDPRAFVGDAVEGAASADLSEDDLFLAFLGTLQDGVADLYEERPAALRQALADFLAGRVRPALAALDELLAKVPDDPVALLERGRCRLASGDAAGARADLEAAWESWGDEPLDLAEQTSVPALWADAALEAGAPAAVAERLAELAEPRRGRADLARPYALALLESGRFEDARDFLAAAAPRFATDQDLPYLLARALAHLGDRAGAAACLESAVAPSCAGGSCNKPPLHLPSVRTLAALHLEDADGLQRAGELLTHLARATGGRLAAADHLLLARFHELDGQPAAAAEARAEAERLGG